MGSPLRVSTTLALAVCVFASQLSSTTLFAAERTEPAVNTSAEATAGPTPSLLLKSQATARALPIVSRPFLKPQFAVSDLQIYQGAPYPYPNHRDASIAAIMIGATAVITGTALLVYANRPDCSINPVPGGCGYGMKVVGGSVLSGGIVGLFVGALTWR